MQHDVGAAVEIGHPLVRHVAQIHYPFAGEVTLPAADDQDEPVPRDCERKGEVLLRGVAARPENERVGFREPEGAARRCAIGPTVT